MVESIGYGRFGTKRANGGVVGLGCVVLLLACLSLAVASPAWAHAKLVESDPAGGDILAEPPEQVRLRFDKPVHFEETGGAGLGPLDPIKVYSEDGTRVDKGNTRVSPDDPKILLVDLKKLSEGVFGVDWDVTSKDGHVIDGALGFTVESAGAAREGAADPEAKNEEDLAAGIPMAAMVTLLIVASVVGLAALVALRRR
jgi:methionine-rich copper-binding protein CopC